MSDPTPDASYPLASLPETQAGRLLNNFLGALADQISEQIMTFVRRHIDTTLSESDPVRLGHSYFGLSQETGGLQWSILESSSETELSGYAFSLLLREWYRVRVVISPDNPDRISELILRPVQRPFLAGPHPVLNDTALVEHLKAALQRSVDVDLFSGAVLLARNGQPLFRKAYGYASLATKSPNRIDTRFNVGSLYKTFTATGVCQLAQQNRLTLDDPVSKYLPDFHPDIAIKLTIHQLLTHTSGMGNYWNEHFEAQRVNLRSVKDFIPLFENDALLFEPGTRWLYSNSGYILLGAIIESITGQDYYEYTRQHIFRPAGMINTDAYEMDYPHENLAIGYTSTDLADRFHPGQRRNNLFIHVVKGTPAGGGFSTIDDLMAFDRALRSGILLNAWYFDIMTSGKVAIGNIEGRQYAYGMMVNIVSEKRIVGHSGSFPGIGARLDMYLDHGYTAIILSNYDPHITQALGNKLREWIAGY